MAKYREDQHSIQAWAEEAFGEPTGAMRLAMRANMEMSELLVEAQGNNKGSIVEEAADVLICLYRIADACGYDLHQIVDDKMAINRKRKWISAGDGTGFHAKEPTDA